MPRFSRAFDIRIWSNPRQADGWLEHGSEALPGRQLARLAKKLPAQGVESLLDRVCQQAENAFAGSEIPRNGADHGARSADRR
jgi:hypothetical protein